MNNTEAMPMLFEPGVIGAEGSIPLCVPLMRGNEWAYVKDCLDTNWVSSAGPYVDRFERLLASYIGTAHAVATVNGTAAIHVALVVAGVEPDDEVILPALTFIAPANAVRYARAWPVFVDIEPNYWQLDPQKVTKFLKEECHNSERGMVNRTTGRRVRAIMPVDILGHPCDMDALTAIADQFDLVIVEDATESLGAKYKNRSVGSDSHIACLSFNGNKIITTGGGGMIVTNNDEWARRAKYLTTQAKDDPVEYIHEEVGYNYRLPNVQAAIGCAQMELLDEFVSVKRRIAATYKEAFAEIPGIEFMKEADWAFSTYWLCTVLVDQERYGCDRRELLERLSRRQIHARPLWQPIHRSKAHAQSPSYSIEVTDHIHARALSLPSSVGISDDDLCKVIDVVISRS